MGEILIAYGNDVAKKELFLEEKKRKVGILEFFTNLDGFNRRSGWYICNENYFGVSRLLEKNQQINVIFFCDFLSQIPNYIQIKAEKFPFYLYKDARTTISGEEFWNMYFADRLMNFN